MIRRRGRRGVAVCSAAVLLLLGVVSCGTGSGDADIYSVANMPPAAAHRCQVIVFASPLNDSFERVVMDRELGRALRKKSFVVFDTSPGSRRMLWESLGVETRPIPLRMGETVFLVVMMPGRFANEWGGTDVGGGQVPGIGEVRLVKLSRAQAIAYEGSPNVYR